MKKAFLSAVFVLALPIFVFAQKAIPTDPRGVIVFGEENNGETFRIGKSDVLMISLLAELGTGYDWRIVGYDKKILKYYGKNTIDLSDSGYPVRKTEETYKFKARRKGVSCVKLEYGRRRDKQYRNRKRVVIIVEVE